MTTIKAGGEAGDFDAIWAGVLAARNEIRQHRRAAAIAALREHGIELTSFAPGHGLTLEHIEALAKVASTFTEQEG